MDIRELRTRLGDTQSEFAARYNIPFRTVQNWEAGIRKPPEYVIALLEKRIYGDLINHKTVVLPKHDPHKIDLPKRSDYVSSLSWLKAVQQQIGMNIVFALDEALMCQGSFNGRSDEYIIWVYGDDEASRYNGVVVLGNWISPNCVKERNGLRFTDFSRTLSDAFANESILDMQGITEAVSWYYYSNDESFNGISVAPEYQDRFDRLAIESIEYYNS
ncbi:MAG: helix-turn-helix domain-containing protein [Erysipelotrichaceae bacterium]|nr:helix-turn-helix domain-containing protein [Erysipelotrichaceae bacterium]